ncbi:asparaginase domain-containing protein [Corynebacterium sp. USCH3]|uniref:asparaginase domain-containing protein n=1 Tax=Corynebacterium sp. USCH3 TaxID=3024840 RepID=UPI0030A5DCE1
MTDTSADFPTVLATGGTISCTADARGDLVPTLNIDALLEDAGLDRSSVTARDILRLDSSTMSLRDLDALLAEIHEAGRRGPVVVTHGTDSMEETAMAVDRLIGGPVVLTGAQRPADDDAPDGPGNLRDAVAAAAHVDAPCVVFGGRTLPAYGVRKIHTSADAAFDTPPLPRPAVPGTHGTHPAPLDGLRVDIVAACQGSEPTLVESAVRTGADGIVVAAFGSGNVGVHAEGISVALAEGIPVVVASRVAAGGVQLVYGGAGGGRSLARAGVRSAGQLTAAQARMELLCELAVHRAGQATGGCPGGPQG